MHRYDLLRAVARTTGESLSTIKRLGFHLEAVTLQRNRLNCNRKTQGFKVSRVKAKKSS